MTDDEYEQQYSLAKFFRFFVPNSETVSSNIPHNLPNNFTGKEKQIVENAINFRKLSVSNVMLPRSQIVAVSHEASIQEIQNTILTSEHSRLPVYQKNLDNILGFIHAKDLIRYINTNQKFHIESIIRNVLFVPESMSLQNLFANMKSANTHIAIVLDDYGGNAGLVTLEDVVESIMGEIEDEHDQSVNKQIRIIEQNSEFITFETNGITRIEDIENELKISFSSIITGDFDSIAGMVIHIYNQLPQKDDEINFKDRIIFQILDATDRRVKHLRCQLFYAIPE